MTEVTIVTPTIGKPELEQNIHHVSSTYDDCIHLIVIDGFTFKEKVDDIIEKLKVKDLTRLSLLQLPWNVGGDGFYSHRVIASIPHLINTKYVAFIDEDNFIEPNHIKTCIETIEAGNYDYVHSLRKIVDKNGNFICEDNCESLGRYPIYGDKRYGHLIDTSCFFYKTEFLIKVCHLWHSKWGADRRFFEILTKRMNHYKYACTGKYTLNYRLEGNEGSVTKEFFIEGNKKTTNLYGINFPWVK